MSNPDITFGSAAPLIRRHSETFDTAMGMEPPRASFILDVDCLAIDAKTEITITIEPQPNGTFVTRYAAKIITP